MNDNPEFRQRLSDEPEVRRDLKRRSTASSAAYLLAGQGSVYLVNFITTVILTRRLGPSVFGVFVTLITLRDTAAAATSLMVNLAILKYRDDAAIVARVSIGLLAALSVVFLAAEALLFAYVYQLPIEMAGALALLSIAHIVGLLYGPYSAMLQIRDAYRHIALSTAIATVCASVIAVGASFFTQGLAPLVLREIVFSALVVTLMIFKLGAFLLPLWKPESLRKVLRLSAELWASRTAEVWIDRRDKVNIGALTSVEGMAFYNLGKYLAELTQLLINPLTVLLFDKYTDPEIRQEKKRAAMDILLLSLLIGGIAGAAAIYYGGHAAVGLLYGEAWIESAHVLQAFTGYAMLYPLYIVVKNAGYAENRARLVVATQIVYLAAILLVPAFSRPGEPLLSPWVHLFATAAGIAVIAFASDVIRTSTGFLCLAAALSCAYAAACLDPLWVGIVMLLTTAAAGRQWSHKYASLKKVLKSPDHE